MFGIGELLSALNVLEKLGRLWGWLQGRQKQLPETVAWRFFRLFESHQVHRNQIPRFFGNGLTLQDMQSETALLPKLEEQVLQAACDLFAVRREWLDGVDAQAFPMHDFYQRPQVFEEYLRRLKESNAGGQLSGVLLAPNDSSASASDAALIILYEIVGWIGDKPVYRYHLLNNWFFEYWKSRADLAAVVAIAWKLKVRIRGRYLPHVRILGLEHGEAFFADPFSFSGELWYPEYMALKPDVFLDGINPEKNNFGFVSALDLWLRLEEQGLMDTGLKTYNKQEVRKLFLEAKGGANSI